MRPMTVELTRAQSFSYEPPKPITHVFHEANITIHIYTFYGSLVACVSESRHGQSQFSIVALMRRLWR